MNHLDVASGAACRRPEAVGTPAVEHARVAYASLGAGEMCAFSARENGEI